MNLNSTIVSFEKNKLIIEHNGIKKIIKLEYEIGKIEKFNDCIVVIIDPPLKTVFNENVFGISYDGKIIWQIQKMKYIYDDSPFTGMVPEDSNVKLFNWDGTDIVVNPTTGKIIKKGFSK